MHQEALCEEVLMLSSTMKIIIKVINLIRDGNGSLLHKKKFQAFLQDENLCLYNDVRWLKFLQNESNTSIKDIQENFKKIKFLSELAFLTDITCHLNHLDLQLQKQNNTISDLTGYVNGFQNKLKLFIIELEANELHHFPSCEEIAKCQSNVNFLIFRPQLLKIQEQFHRCFKDFNLLKNDLQIFNNPRGCIMKEQEIPYRLELCNLQADPFLLSRNKYDLGLKICSMFGSTYKCENGLSIMKYIKSKYRAMLTEESLCSLLRLATSIISIDIPSLVNEMTHPQFSH
ncbi:general transcription factor II-I repeat domain-containing protein 2B-like [Vespa crabro]|uniref:general transcription factor II-I repeat domain-containing protein 2B-like n=1 Tax=Vespa crabro TaxID=7445 RepID=UPI001EFFE195|nr:general transcription factor II-I repeat domain-containing protein 2B-like [Vespa crabro]